MKLETFKSQCNEIFVEGNGVQVTVNTWANHEGVSFQVHSGGLQTRSVGMFRWEELDVLLVALQAARAN